MEHLKVHRQCIFKTNLCSFVLAFITGSQPKDDCYWCRNVQKTTGSGPGKFFKHELSLYGATVKIKDKKDLCVFPIYEALATSRKSVYQIATQLSIIADPVESKNLSECVKDIFTLERASFFGCGSYLVQLSFSSWS